MWTRVLALVLFVLTLATSPAHASEAPVTGPQLASAWSETPLPAHRKQIHAARAVLVTGAVVLASGAIAFGVGVGTFDFDSGGTGPLIAALYGLVAMPVGFVLTVGGGLSLGFAVRQAKRSSDHELRLTVGPRLVGKSPGLAVAATW